jgi:3'-5' exoribonuclease
LAELEQLCENELHHKPWRKLCLKVLRTESIRAKLLSAYGAKAVHHAYLGGLLEHTLNVCRLALSMADNYPSLDREIILVAAVFHDLGKAWELSTGMSADYTDEGRLLGHILITLEILDPFLKKETGLDPGMIVHLKHIIASHHGEYEFGSPKRPKTGEAFVLHYADNLDAKMNIFDHAFAKQGGGSAWSAYQKYLDRYLFSPQKTPLLEKKGKEKTDGQRLLPFSLTAGPTE